MLIKPLHTVEQMEVLGALLYTEILHALFSPLGIYYLIQNSQAVKNECGPQKGYGEKRCEIQGGGQEMAVMAG